MTAKARTRADVDAFFESLPNAVEVQAFDGGLLFRWSRTGVGFGELTLIANEDGRLVADTETMSDEFCLDVIAQALTERVGT